MSRSHRDDDQEYIVIRNTKFEHTIWPADRPLPEGWEDAGFRGSKDECVNYAKGFSYRSSE